MELTGQIAAALAQKRRVFAADIFGVCLRRLQSNKKVGLQMVACWSTFVARFGAPAFRAQLESLQDRSIKLVKLTKSYGASGTAVKELTLTLKAGEVFALLGHNGAGKSTTISMLIGLITPDSGQVELAGYGAPQSPEVRRVLGIAPQSISLYDVFTTIENLTFFCRLYHLSSAITADRIEWAFDFSGLGDRKKSRGMRPQNIPFLILFLFHIYLRLPKIFELHHLLSFLV